MKKQIENNKYKMRREILCQMRIIWSILICFLLSRLEVRNLENTSIIDNILLITIIIYIYRTILLYITILLNLVQNSRIFY